MGSCVVLCSEAMSSIGVAISAKMMIKLETLVCEMGFEREKILGFVSILEMEKWVMFFERERERVLAFGFGFGFWLVFLRLDMGVFD